MVRKRSRTSRKYYDSDDNDSDSDFALDDPPPGPTQKKYSLRQRKRPLFTEDFDYDDDGEEVEAPKVPSDDDDFEVEKELEIDEAPESEYVDKTTYINHYEPDTDEIPEDAEGLIDFEDMIRADIVVNKNRIDYDNLIQKTEIKVQPIEETLTQPVKSKRGRKPKARPAEEVDSSILEPETEVQETEYDDKNDKDYDPDDDLQSEVIDCAKLMQTELTECQAENELNPTINEEITLNGPKLSENEENKSTEDKIDEAHISSPLIDKSKNIEESLITVNEDSSASQEFSVTVNENPNETLQINGKILTDDSIKNKVFEEKLSKINKCGVKQSTGNYDDDVVLVEDEKKCDVIVLDD